MNTQKVPLNGQLERFVKAENKAFRQELTQETRHREEANKQQFVDPISPSKRKHRSDSMDSMNSNRASLGSDAGNGFDNPFEDQSDKPSVEMVDFTTSNMGFNQQSATEDANLADAPGLPPRNPNADATDNASATMTPNTFSAEGDDVPSAKTGQEQSSSVTREPHAAASKEPEMQERVNPPSITRPSQSPERTRRDSIMDMDNFEQHTS